MASVSTAPSGPSSPPPATTLSIDVGGSGLKASVLDPQGQMVVDRVRVDTPYPCPPEKLVSTLVDLVSGLPEHDRISVGFPGMVRKGVVLHVPSLSREVPGGPEVPERAAQWNGFDLEDALLTAFDKPVLVMNDADVQACAAVSGHGFELVLTLGTGVGTAVFSEGTLLPHMELSHFVWRHKESYDLQLGEAARQEVGNDRWSRRVEKALDEFERVLFPDTIYLGGGNTKHLKVDLSDRVTIVPNAAGILGGIRVWQMHTA